MFRLLIRNNETREERLSRPIEIEWNDGTLYWLSEGNYGCDCNRWLEFQRAAELPEQTSDLLDQALEMPCTNGRFTIIKAIFPDESFVLVDENSGDFDHRSFAN